MVNTNYQAAAGPGAQPRAWPRPTAAWYFVFILDIFNIFEYIFADFNLRGLFSHNSLRIVDQFYVILNDC